MLDKASAIARGRLIAYLVGAYAQASFITLLIIGSYGQLIGQWNFNSIFSYQPKQIALVLGFFFFPMLLAAPALGLLHRFSQLKSFAITIQALICIIVLLFFFNENAPWLSFIGLIGILLATNLVIGNISLNSTLQQSGWSKPVLLGAILAAMFAGSTLALLVGSRLQLGISESVFIFSLISLVTTCLWANPPQNADRTFGVQRRLFQAGAQIWFSRFGRACWFGIVWWAFTLSALLAGVLRSNFFTDATNPTFPKTMLWFGLSVAGGALFSWFQRHSYRVAAGLVYGPVLILIGTTVGYFSHHWTWNLILVGIGIGMATTPIVHLYNLWTNHISPIFTTTWAIVGWVLGLAFTVILAYLLPQNSPQLQKYWVLATIVSSFGILILFILNFTLPAFEALLELLLWPVYRFRTSGQAILPTRGPCIIIANHAAYMDPVLLGKIVPSPMTPLMTSAFYDKKLIYPLMKLVGTIRVADAGFRKEAPELQEAVAALDRGECVVIFPEAYLRRKESQVLRRFGRGIWHILQDRPTIPVYCVWIEGNWGSFTSYFKGPPGKNKSIDFWRAISFGVHGPVELTEEILQDQMKTRQFLMQELLVARAELGLPPLEPGQIGMGESND
ncbi:MAG: 1-acyl-sn-glycerol-3-phosphate acyltransferase [Zavarzinella sp.]